MRKLPHTAAEDLLEIMMRRYERFSTLLTSKRSPFLCEAIGHTRPGGGRQPAESFNP